MPVIALDIGGTKIEGAVVGPKGKIIKSLKIPTEPRRGRKKVLENISFVIDELRKGQKDIRAIGIGMPGFFDRNFKIISAGAVKCLEGFNLKRYLEKDLKLPVFVENDANCFALAEAVLGAGKKYRNVIGVIWGTGIGGGIVIDRNIYRGAVGGAGEFGHMTVDSSLGKGHRCGCGQYGCLENFSSGKSIVRRYKEEGGKKKFTDNREVYDSQDRAARKVIDEAVHYLGVGMGILVQSFDPDIIIFGGGVSNLPDSVYGRIRKEVEKYSMPMLARDVKIVRHALKENAGVIGAAMLAYQGIESGK